MGLFHTTPRCDVLTRGDSVGISSGDLPDRKLWMMGLSDGKERTILVGFVQRVTDRQTDGRKAYPTYFNSELHHAISAPVTIVCFTMLESELFSAVVRSATPLRQYLELTTS